MTIAARQAAIASAKGFVIVAGALAAYNGRRVAPLVVSRETTCSHDRRLGQEGPRNMGAWRFVREQFQDGCVPGGPRSPRYIGRPPSVSPAPGSHKAHVREQEAIVAHAVGDAPAAIDVAAVARRRPDPAARDVPGITLATDRSKR